MSLVALGARSSQATLIITPSTTVTNELAYPATANDLINSGQGTLGSVVTTGYTNFGNFSIAGLNNGTLGTASVDTAAATFDLDGVWTSEFNLNLQSGLQSSGYNITEIRTIVGWAGSRAGQKYTLEYSTVGSPLFTPLGGTFSLTFASTGSSQITITDTTGIIASGVDALRFNIMSPGGGSESVYREIDVFGVEVSVPEPSTLALLGLGVVGLAVRHRRRRKV